MKTKILPLIIIFFTLLACQKNDDESSVETIDDAIIGQWEPVQNIKIYENGNEEVTPFPNCPNTTDSHLYFSDDINQLFYYVFIEQITDDDCFYTGGQGNWEKLDENEYQVSIDYFVDSDYQSDEIENFLYQVDFISNDIIQIHHKTLLLEMQMEEPNLIDFYRVYEKQRIPFE